MKQPLLTAGFVLLSFMLPVKASAANFTQIYAFGDSLVDNGNVFTASLNTFPPFPYYQGRFSNGPVWVEYLANDWGVQLSNFAYGGATTGKVNTLNKEYPQLPPLPGLTQQIQSFVGANQQVDNQALYVMWAGANDYLRNNNVTDPTEPITNLLSAITSLASVGAKNFLIANLPNLGSVPGTQGNPNSANLNLLTGFHNSGLNQSLNLLKQQQPNLNIQLFDANFFVNQVINNKEKFGFTNVTDACLNIVEKTICSNPNEYLFWDNIHPTSYAHSLIAQHIGKQIPEPSTTLSLLGIAAVSAAGIFNRKGQQ